MKFSLSTLFWAVLGFALFISIRVVGVRAENELVVLSSSIFLSAAFGMLGASCGLNIKWIAVVAIAAGFLPCVAWSLECMLQLPSSSFLRKTNIQKSYSTSLDLNVIMVIVWGAGASIFGMIAGFFVRALRL